jgi:hypothetical protein
MTKNILLAATAASVMAFAGAASAHTLTFRTDAGAVGPDIGTSIDAGETSGAALPFKLAAEAKPAAPTFKQFDLVNTLSSGNIPSGNVVLTVTVTNGTFSSGLTAANVTAGAGCSTFTAVPSSGGASGSTVATFVISNSLPNCSSFNLDLPIAPGASGPVSVQTRLATEFGVAIDGLDSPSFQIVTRPSAFGVTIDSTIGVAGGALDNTFATLLQTPVYTQFRNGAGTGGHNNGTETITLGQLGTIQINLTPSVYRDLNSNLATAADVTAASVVVTGNFAAFDNTGDSGAVTLGTGAASPLAAGTATFSGAAYGGAGGVGTNLVTAAQPFRVQRETTAVTIPSSTYSASVTYTLDSTYYNQEAAVVGALETIERDGTNIILPWMNSTSVQTATGTTNIVRLGNINSAASGPVFAQVLNSANAGVGYTPAAAPQPLFPSIAANGERVITTAILTAALGEWGRGDVQISIEAPSNTITARRFATLANGSITEFNSGTVANDQNQLNVP